MVEGFYVEEATPQGTPRRLAVKAGVKLMTSGFFFGRSCILITDIRVYALVQPLTLIFFAFYIR